MNVKAKMWSCLEKKMNKVGFFDYIFQYCNTSVAKANFHERMQRIIIINIKKKQEDEGG